ncbi:MAG: hypothetical protein ABI633_00735 [Burkholderiales bacterium]
MNAKQDSSTIAARGDFKPVALGHVIVSFARQWQLDEGLLALVELGFGREVMHRTDDPAMIATIAQDLTSLSLRNETWLTQAQRDFARRGHCWLVLRTQSDGRAFQMADCVISCGATSVQYYGNMIVEELLDKPSIAPPRQALRAQLKREKHGESANDPSATEG